MAKESYLVHTFYPCRIINVSDEEYPTRQRKNHVSIVEEFLAFSEETLDIFLLSKKTILTCQTNFSLPEAIRVLEKSSTPERRTYW